MRFFLIAVSALAVATSVKIGEPEKSVIISPKAAGSLHTEAFVRLANRFADKKPDSRYELMHEVGHVLGTFCNGDETCIERGHRNAGRTFYELDAPSSDHPNVIDSHLRDCLRRMRDVINMVTTHEDIDEIVTVLLEIESEVEGMEDVNEAEKQSVLSGLSVATESAVMWQAVYKNPQHPLHGLHLNSYYTKDANKRLLDESPATENGKTTNIFDRSGSATQPSIRSGPGSATQPSVTETDNNENIFNISLAIQWDVWSMVDNYFEELTADPGLIMPDSGGYLILGDAIGLSISASAAASLCTSWGNNTSTTECSPPP